MSALADRIKIARNYNGYGDRSSDSYIGNGGGGDDINLSIQYILNCGGEHAGSCHGGSPLRLYQFIKRIVKYVPYDTCQPYLACSENSTEGFCSHVDTTCTPMNTCRTCTSILGRFNLQCSPITSYPNATISDYGVYRRKGYNLELDDYYDDSDDHNSSSHHHRHARDDGIIHAIKSEIYARGPVVAGLAGHPLTNYTGGIYDDVTASRNMTHAVSIVGWGTQEQDDNDTTGGEKRQYWIVRNSWGEYWGNMGYFNVLMGQNVLGIETKITWATPGNFTVLNFPCYEDGSNCGVGGGDSDDSIVTTQTYIDPSHNIQAIQRRLKKKN